MKLMQFLMGLDDSYMQIRRSILSREVLADVRSAYATISCEESHRFTAGSIAGSSQRNQASAFVSRANQHMTYNDKELDNVLDIPHLKIKVGHPNETEAFISKIGNLKLSNGFVLLGHPAKPVLNVLKESLQIDNKNKNVCCEICQRAKQTREYFPLSDHTSKFLGDLVHLDLCGPYKVASFERFRYFFTVVDDYTRAIWQLFFGGDVNTADFPVSNSGNDAYSSDDIIAAQNEETDAMNQEMDALLRNGTWEINELPKDRKAIGSIDYEETFSHVVKMVTVSFFKCLQFELPEDVVNKTL
ncbi:hypothetical protein Tco_0740386 [Tanacetum coccineum]